MEPTAVTQSVSVVPELAHTPPESEQKSETNTKPSAGLAAPRSRAKAARPAAPASSGSHPLHDTWTLWEIKGDTDDSTYLAALNRLATVSTVEEFWKYFGAIASPSFLFSDGFDRHLLVRDGKRTHIGGLCCFRSSIIPTWEDKANRNGGEWSTRVTLKHEVLDAYWEAMVLGAIGETLGPNGVIAGVRIVDKSSDSAPLYRLEVWFSCDMEDAACTPVVQTIREVLMSSLAAAVSPDVKVPQFRTRTHKVR